MKPDQHKHTYVSEPVEQTMEGMGFLTGFFRDGKRRIDLVLVTKDTGDEAIERIKTDFLLKAMNMGLDLEIEAGFDERLIDLVFIKIHAREDMLRGFGFYYNLKKFFKKSHIEFIKPHVKGEKELIKTIRLWYPGPGNYSTIDRSTIVYRALLSCPFGKPFNYVGIDQLIDKKIFLDVYPLHDGPCFLTEGQTPLELNGRQALYYSWCQLINLFVRNPAHLIREYFGERIGFLLTFYQMYNWWLAILSIPGIALFISNYLYKGNKVVLNENGEKNSYKHYRITGDVEYNDLPVCPKCWDIVACPFRNMSAYEGELKIRVFLTNPYNFFWPFIVFIWGTLFYIFWKRRENYLSWLWECTDKGFQSFVRPTKFREPKNFRSKESSAKRTWTRAAFCNRREDILQLLFMILVLSVIFFVYFPVMLTVNNKLLNRIRYVEDWQGVSQSVERVNHAVIDTLGALHAVLIIVLEYLWFHVSGWMAKTFPKPRSAWWHEMFYSVDLFGVSLLINLIMLFYYGFVKGALYWTPNNDYHWGLPLGLGVAHCGLLTCVDEVFILFIATYKTKVCIEDLYRLLEWKAQDYERLNALPPPAPPRPCWEREYFLKPVKEAYFYKNLNRILLQNAVVTGFVSCFQLGPLLAFLWNIWHQNYMADMLVIYSRRPLLTHTWGLGAWNYILITLPCLACVLNHNTIMHIRINKKYWAQQAKRRFLADYYMGFFRITNNELSSTLAGWRQYKEKDEGSVPHFCMYPGHMIIVQKEGDNQAQYKPLAGYYYALWHQLLFFFLYMIITMVTGVMLHVALSTRPRAVQEELFVEAAVRRYRATRLRPPQPRLPARLPRLPPARPPVRSQRSRSPSPAAGDAPRSPHSPRSPRSLLRHHCSPHALRTAPAPAAGDTN